MDKWFKFYGELFNFKETRFFNLEGKFKALFESIERGQIEAGEFAAE